MPVWILTTMHIYSENIVELENYLNVLKKKHSQKYPFMSRVGFILNKIAYGSVNLYSFANCFFSVLSTTMTLIKIYFFAFSPGIIYSLSFLKFLYRYRRKSVLENE